MRKFVLAVLLVPGTLALSVGCGSKANKVVEPSPQADQDAESKQATEELETTE